VSDPREPGASLWVLGAGTALPRPALGERRFGPAGYAWMPAPGGPVTLLDCGPGSVRQLGALGIALERVERVVLTHFHPDHCLDVFALTFARRNPALLGLGPLELLGPPGLTTWYERGVFALGEWVRDRQINVIELDFAAWAQGLYRGTLRLSAAPTGHTPNALALRLDFEERGLRKAWVYSGDSGPNPALTQLARGAELLVCDCSFPDGAARPDHLTPAGAGRVALDAGVQHLVLTHFYPELDPEAAVRGAQAVFSGSVTAAHDGLCIRPAASLPSRHQR
jgi:ribonuclease BN (tRNA processing enzyme)